MYPTTGCAEDFLIIEDDVLLRRIARYGDTNMVIADEATGELRVRSGAFVMNDDGCSVYCQRILEQNDMSALALVRRPQNAVVSVTALAVDRQGLAARADPNPPVPEPHPRDVAHALIVRPEALSKNATKRALSNLAKSAEFVISGTG